MNIPHSAIKPFGSPRILDELIGAYVVEKLIQLAEDINSLSPDDRRRFYANMHPIVREVLKSLHLVD